MKILPRLAYAIALAAPATGIAGSLQEVLFNLNGVTYNTYAVPGLNSAGFNETTGLGTLTLTLIPAPPGVISTTCIWTTSCTPPSTTSMEP
jgi:hypothetical protein